MDGFAGIGGDLVGLATEGGPIGWFFLLGLVLLPVLGVVLLRRGSRLAWGAIAAFGAVMVVWFQYHMTDWWPNSSAPMALLLLLVGVGVGWLFLGASAWSLRRRRRLVSA